MREHIQEKMDLSEHIPINNKAPDKMIQIKTQVASLDGENEQTNQTVNFKQWKSF